MNLKILRKRLALARKLAGFDEPDTIERLVVPVLEIAGWPVNDLNPMYLRRGNRDNRSSQRVFDLQLHADGRADPLIVIECKKLSSTIFLEGKGASCNTKDQYDFVRQLRNDCLNPRFSCRRSLTTPVLTNGEHWIIFNSAFLDPERKDENISKMNFTDFVQHSCSLGDKMFEKSIVEALQKGTPNNPMHADGNSATLHSRR